MLALAPLPRRFIVAKTVDCQHTQQGGGIDACRLDLRIADLFPIVVLTFEAGKIRLIQLPDSLVQIEGKRGLD